MVNIGHHGEADIWGHRIFDGRAFYIEVKLPGEHPRPDQRKFLEAMRNTGALAGVAHSVEEALIIVQTTEACPLGGDITNDCADCVYSGDYHYTGGDCVRREGTK